MKRFFCALLCVFFLLWNVHFPAYAEETKQVIKVGIPLCDGFLEESEDGTYQGYMYTYLQKISEYTAWDYEIITDNEDRSKQDLFTMLDQGELDVLMSVRLSEENKEKYLFPDKNIGNSYVTLAVSSKDMVHVPGDYASYEGMRIGYLKDDERSYAALQHFADSYEFSFEAIPYETNEELREDVLRQSIDGMIGPDIVADANLRINNRFSSTQIGIAMRKSDRDLFSDLNFALESIHEVNINFDTQLYDTFFPKSTTPQLILSEEEKAYLKDLPEIRVVSGMNTIPIDYFENGKYKGISADLFKKISELTGIKFTYTRAESLDAAYEKIAKKEADIITGLYNDDVGKRPQDVTYISPLGMMQMVVIKNHNVEETDFTKLTMAQPEGFYRIDDIDAKNVETYANLEECILAVYHGKADFVYGSAYGVQYYVRKHGITNVDLAPLSNASRSLMIGTSKDVDPLMISILNKAIHCIDDEEREQIYFHNVFDANNEVTLPAFIRMHFAKVLFVVIAFMMVACIAIIRSVRKKRKDEIASIRRYQMMADLSQDFIFEYDFVKDILMLSNQDAERLGVPALLDNFLKSVTNQEFFFSREDIAILTEEELHDPQLNNFKRDFVWTSIDGKSYQIHALILVQRDEKHHPLVCIGKLSKNAA